MKRQKYYFCEGLNGVVVAHDLKQAIKLLSKYFTNTKNEAKRFYKELMKELKSQDWKSDWCVEKEQDNERGKSRVVGWCE